MRRMGRTQESRVTNSIEEHMLIPKAGYTKWCIYDGPIAKDENAPGWINSLWAATCIPYSLYHNLPEMPNGQALLKIREKIRLLRINQTTIKVRPTPETHVILAPPPEARPSEGYLEEIPVARRENKGAVKKGVSESKTTTTIADKVIDIRSQLKNTSLAEIMYPDQGDMWVGNIRQSRDSLEVYTEVDDEPLLRVSRSGMAINTERTIFAHEPNQMKFKTKENNPMAEILPSTSGVPVDSYLPYVGEIVEILSIAKAIAEFFKKQSDDGGETETTSSTDRITEVIDYQTMRRWYSYEENV